MDRIVVPEVKTSPPKKNNNKKTTTTTPNKNNNNKKQKEKTTYPTLPSVKGNIYSQFSALEKGIHSLDDKMLPRPLEAW